MKLMIVESPNKVKKISAYLGAGWKVAASVGHIRDLPEKDMGLEPPSFKPTYVVSRDKKKSSLAFVRCVQKPMKSSSPLTRTGKGRRLPGILPRNFD